MTGIPARVYQAFGRGPQSLSELAEPLDVSLQAVRKHVNLLEDVGRVTSRRSGKHRVCQLEPGEIARAARWLLARTDVWNRRLDRLQRLPDEEE